MDKVWIPRNLNNSDHLKMFGLKFKMTDLPFLLIVTFIAYFITQSLNNIFVKTIIFAVALSFGYLANNIKFYNQTIVELLFNKLLYGQRRKRYKRGIKT